MSTVAPPAKPRRTPRPHGKNSKTAQRSGADLTEFTRRDRQDVRYLNWWGIGWLGLAHLGALYAPWVFTWEALAATVVLHWVCGGIGICLGYHRTLTHSSFKTYPAVRYFLAVIGSIAGEGSPIDWVADHRKHHAKSDQPGDPHSPLEGGWWSHMLWLAFSTHANDSAAYRKRWAPDLVADRGMRTIEKLFLPLNFALAAALAGFGYWLGGTPMAVSMVVWAFLLRMVFVLHSTWLVNSASHMWGYKNYETTDDSRNNWFVALVTYGEGWHNNHHAYPRMAKHGHRWWEVDLTFMTIRLMQRLGLVWDVVDYRSAAEKKSRGA